MNPLTNMKNVTKLSEQELYTSNKTSWHDQYRDSAWIFIGGLPFDLTEGDIIAIFSQYGEIVNINLIRDKDSGKSKGFCFLCYEDQRSTILAVDNLNGIRVLNRIVRVDHVSNYKVPKQGKKTDEETKKLYEEGCAPKAEPIQLLPAVTVKPEPYDIRETLADQIDSEIRLPRRLPIYTVKKEVIDEEPVNDKKEKKKHKKNKKKKSKKSKKTRHSSSESSSENYDEAVKKKKKKKSRNLSEVEDDSSDEKGDSDESIKKKKMRKSKMEVSESNGTKSNRDVFEHRYKDTEIKREPRDRSREYRSFSRSFNKT